ncbi:glycoside hydrolase family 127 protein [Sunxiuqinia sp. A32]|uniref:glycoside hydrolase family 127 protein n=1 Tax=Sunxiuqinia sp. A32 TaxID=3461496 RepID=UPI004045C4B6
MGRILSAILILSFLLSCSERGKNEKSNSTDQKALVLEHDYPIKPVEFTKVSINDNFWAPRIKTNREVTVPYTFQKSEETGRISNFAIAGGLEDGEFKGIYFDDSDVFKIIEGASYTLMVEENPDLRLYLDNLIAKIAAAQEDDGYLYTNRTINPEKAADGGGRERWTRLDIFHELYNVGHMYEAAVAHYQATGERSLLDVAIKNADLIVSVFGPGKNMGVPGHEEIEIGLIKLYRVTGNEKYFDLAKFFVDQRGNAEGHDLYGDNYQDHMPFSDQTEAVGHSVRACYFYAGATDVAALSGSDHYDEPLNNIWEDIVYRKIYLTGGIGAEPKFEGFGPKYHLPNATAYTETCAAISLMLWNHRMFLRTGEVKYMDVFERTLYNGFLSGVSFEGNKFFYPNPLESDGEFKFNHGNCERSPWFDCSCCPVNIVRILPSLPGYVYATKEDQLFVNLYIGNSAEIQLGDEKVSISQTTNYPWEGKVLLEVNNDISKSMTLNLRVPAWVRNEVMPGNLYTYADQQTPSFYVSVNGKKQEVTVKDGFITLDKQNWKENDQVEISFEMPVRKVIANEKVAEDQGKIALERGPLVYCAEAADNPNGVLNVKVNPKSTFNYQFNSDLFTGIGQIKGENITAIPYYAWANRGANEMAVWLKTSK